MAFKCRVLKGGECEITQEYGVNGHLGTDIVGKGYTLDGVVAHSDGVVVMVQTGHKNNQGSTGNASYGNMVKIDHGNGDFTLYAHLDKVYVTNGQKVAKGQDIGYMGNTGNSYGAHLHFEVFKNNNRVSSQDYLNADIINPLVKPVKRDESKDQLKVNVDDLRIRKNAGTNQAILGLATLNGIYNYFEVKEQGGYTWYKLAEGQWIANADNWCDIYPKIDLEEQTMIEELKKQIEVLEKEKQELVDKNKLLEVENTILKDEESQYMTFTASETHLYHIHLEEGETIKYEKGL